MSNNKWMDGQIVVYLSVQQETTQWSKGRNYWYMLSKRSQAQEYILYDSSYMKRWNKAQQQKAEQWLPGAGDWEEGVGEFDYKGARGNFWGGGSVIYLDCCGGYMGIYICQNSLTCILHT